MEVTPKQKLICVLTAIPAAGKTFLTKMINCQKHLFSHPLIIKHICFDEIYHSINNSNNESVSNDFNQKIWHECRQKALQITIDLLKQSYIDMRHQYYQIAREYQTGFMQIYIECSIESAIQSNSLRKSPDFINPDVIRKSAAIIEKPASNGWESNTFIMSHSNLEIGSIFWKFIENSFFNIPHSLIDDHKQKLADQIITQKNLYHKLDLLLRKALKDFISNLSPSQQNSFGFSLNQIRRQYLQNLKNISESSDISDLDKIIFNFHQQCHKIISD